MSAFYELHEPATDGIDERNDRKWRKEQCRRLWILVGMSFTGDTSRNKKWRMLRCYQIFRKRLWRLEGCEWIRFLAGLSYVQAVGEIRDPILQCDLARLCKTAQKTCEKWGKEAV